MTEEEVREVERTRREHEGDLYERLMYRRLRERKGSCRRILAALDHYHRTGEITHPHDAPPRRNR